MTTIIEARNLSKKFGDTPAVEQLSLSVPEGRLLSVLGPNGAGKTTTLKMLTTLLKPDEGTISICGLDVVKQPNQARTMIGLAGQSAAVDEKLTARENMSIFGRLYGLPKKRLNERIEELIEQFRLHEFADRPVDTYSGGQKRRLDIVAALIAEPKALFLDEPTTGLDVRSRNEIWDAVRSLKASGTAVVLTTQYLEEAEQLSDDVVIIDRGRRVASGTPAELKETFGEAVVDVQVATQRDVDAICGQYPDARVARDADSYSVAISVSGGSRHSLEVMDAIRATGIDFIDFDYRKSTLDDVFLKITEE